MLKRKRGFAETLKRRKGAFAAIPMKKKRAFTAKLKRRRVLL